MQSLARKGCRESTLQSYRRNLEFFFQWLGGAPLGRDAASRWQAAMVEQGYMPATVNHRVSSVNGLLAYLGLWEFQAEPLDLPRDASQPELTRPEYLRLLSAARALGRERTYLLVKLFACTGIAAHQVEELTVESLGREGLPPCLREELLRFARQEGLQQGPVFVTRSGKPISRTNITGCIQRLAGDAQVAPEKCNPRCLQRLYRKTQEGIQQHVAQLIEDAHNRLLETEQLVIGWEKAGRAS